MTSWREQPDDEHPFRYDHGVTIWASDADHGHGGHFTTSENPFEVDEDGDDA